MPPKFQSSFIPRNPISSSAPSVGMPVARRRQKDIFSFIATTLFTISVLFALGTFGYKFFLNYRIDTMGQELEAARAAIEPETVNELIRLNSRLVATDSLINKHRIISPVFEFLEAATPQQVRYTEFNFNMTPRGLELSLRGEARSYAALAAAAEVYNRPDSNFRNTAFSNLQLDDQGNVDFSLNTVVEPSLLSYERFVEGITPEAPVTAPVSTTTPPVTNSTPGASTIPGATTTAPQLPPGTN